MRAFKNQKDVYIPLTYLSKSVFRKYDYELPKISEQKFNEYSKEACKIAGITHQAEKIKMVSGNKKYDCIPKHKVVTSHVAVKTFITLCAKKGVSTKAVAKMTGKTLKVILKHYLAIDNTTIDDQMQSASI